MSDPIGSAPVDADPSAYAPSDTFGRVDPLGTLKQMLRAEDRSHAQLGVIDPQTGRTVIAPEPNVPKETLNDEFGIAGHLKFDSDVPASVASEMHDAKVDELRRQDAATRSAGGIGTSLTDLGAGFLDPVNIAAVFIPGVGEARFGGMLARAGLGGLADAGAGLAARSAVRFGSGALDAGIMQAPLVAARYGMSRQEQADYTATDAMADMAMGSLLGGGLHTLGGAVGDVLGRSRVAASSADAPTSSAAPAGDLAATTPPAEPAGVAPDAATLPQAPEARRAPTAAAAAAIDEQQTDLAFEAAAAKPGPIPDQATPGAAIGDDAPTAAPTQPVATMTRDTLAADATTGERPGEIDADKAAEMFHGTIADATARGDQAVLVDAQGRETPLASRDGRTVQASDGAGVGWIGALSETGSRVEIRPGDAQAQGGGGRAGGVDAALPQAAPDMIGEAFRASPAAALVDADPVLREQVLRSSIAAVAEGRPVAADELLQVAAAERGSIPPPPPGADRTVYAPGVDPIQVRPEVVPLDSLVASHLPDGTLNPAYPHDTGIQPRDRTSPQSRADVRNIAANLQPERMDVSPEAQSGAPIVSPAGVVESGNGRTMALGQVYTDPALAGRAADYRAWLDRQGYDTTGIDKPVLVARRLTDLSPDDTRAFGRAANEATTLRMTAAETARADAARAGAALDLWRGSAVTDAGNREFVRSFLGQLPSAERGNLVDRNGGLSADGARRIQSAVLALVYGDSLGPTLERMLNGEGEGMRAIAGAISDAAGAWGQMRMAAERGEIPAGLDITAPLGEAVQLIERQRRTGRPIAEAFTQGDVFGGGPSPEAAALARLMFRDDAMTRPVGRARLGELLRDYAEQAREVSPAADMFGSPPATAADILAAVSRRPDVVEQGGLFGQGAAADRMQDLQQSDAVRRAQGAPDPEQAAIEERAAEAAKAPPAAAPPPPTDLAELEEFAARAREDGTLDPASRAELDAADASVERSGRYTDALANAGDCILRSVS